MRKASRGDCGSETETGNNGILVKCMLLFLKSDWKQDDQASYVTDGIRGPELPSISMIRLPQTADTGEMSVCHAAPVHCFSVEAVF